MGIVSAQTAAITLGWKTKQRSNIIDKARTGVPSRVVRFDAVSIVRLALFLT